MLDKVRAGEVALQAADDLLCDITEDLRNLQHRVTMMEAAR